MVGPQGHVYAWEPDETNCECLLRNLAMHHVENVTVVRKALAGRNGELSFAMDGAASSGLADYVTYHEGPNVRKVQAVTIERACEELGCVPSFIKIDIEGAEIAAISGSSDFLKAHSIQFAIESYHRVDGEYTYKTLDQIFPTIGYEVQSSGHFGQMFTWAHAAEPA